MTYQPATFGDFLDGLSRAMGLPIAPPATDRRATLPAAPAQAALAAELDAEIARMLLDDDLHASDTPSTSTHGKSQPLTFSERRHRRNIRYENLTAEQRAAVRQVATLKASGMTLTAAAREVAVTVGRHERTVRQWYLAQHRGSHAA